MSAEAGFEWKERYCFFRSGESSLTSALSLSHEPPAACTSVPRSMFSPMAVSGIGEALQLTEGDGDIWLIESASAAIEGGAVATDVTGTTVAVVGPSLSDMDSGVSLLLVSTLCE